MCFFGLRLHALKALIACAGYVEDPMELDFDDGTKGKNEGDEGDEGNEGD